MNKILLKIIIFGALSLVTSTYAQRPLTPAQKMRQQEVRTQYAQAQQFAEAQKKDSEYSHVLTTRFNRMESVVGRVEETIEFYSNEREGEYAGVTCYDLWLVHRSIKRPQAILGDIYQEFLFSSKTGNLIFFYSTSSNWWAGDPVNVEYRCYFNEDGSMSSSNVKLKSQGTSSEPYYPDELQDYEGIDALKMQKSMKDAFNALVNSNND